MGTNEYCDVSELFSDKINKVSLIKSFGINYKELHNLYKKNYPKKKNLFFPYELLIGWLFTILHLLYFA